VVLRYGAFYGPDTGLFDGPLIDHLRRRRVPLIGKAGGWWSVVHVDDAAAALAVEKGAPGLYNIVDDDPAPVRQWLPEGVQRLTQNSGRSRRSTIEKDGAALSFIVMLPKSVSNPSDVYG
jgi:nucleoside-diphosphate-sugar epimerase